MPKDDAPIRENAHHYVQEALALAYGGDETPEGISSGPPRGVRALRARKQLATEARVPEALPPELRPRERLLGVGAEGLSSAELLAIVLGGAAADRGSLDLAGSVLAGVPGGGLFGLRGASLHDLLETPEVGEAKAVKILAAVELGKRLAAARKEPGRPKVSSPQDAYPLLKDRLSDLDRENFVCLLLNTKNEVIGSPTIAVGTLSSCPIHPREVFKPAIKASAAQLILAHNHPSGHVRPSREDRESTKRLVEVSKIVGIEVLDHLIVGDGYLSMKEQGLL